MSDVGWFYHAPAKRVNAEQVIAPPASQIPCLNPQLPQEDEPPRMWIRDTDSEFIRLAKMGGRADLLRTRSPKPRSEEPKPYPRVDWFYQDDIRMDREEQKRASQPEEPYQFLLPDYMVHHEYKGHLKKSQQTADNVQPFKAPYAMDKQAPIEECDKTKNIPELRKIGYGVRTEKAQKSDVKKKIQFEDKQHTREDNNMGHLMAHGYVEESHGKQPTRGNTRKASGNQSKAAAPTRQNDRLRGQKA